MLFHSCIKQVMPFLFFVTTPKQQLLCRSGSEINPITSFRNASPLKQLLGGSRDIPVKVSVAPPTKMAESHAATGIVNNCGPSRPFCMKRKNLLEIY